MTSQMHTPPTSPAGSWPSDPLDGAQRTFTWLTVGPDPVSIDGRLFDHLPDRDIPVDQLGALLMADGCPRSVWDAVWTHLILRSRLEGGTWTLACVGLALPALWRIARELTRRFAGDRTDIHAEILRGFLDRLATVDLDQGRIMIRLRWAAYRAGLAARDAAMDGPTPRPPGFCSKLPARPFGHEDLVLVHAVNDGILTETEAALIGTTRLEPVTLSEWAATSGVSYAQAQRSRHRAEQRLAAWLGHASDQDADEDPTSNEVTVRLAVTTRPSGSRTVITKRERSLSGRAASSGLSSRGRALSAPATGDGQAVASCA